MTGPDGSYVELHVPLIVGPCVYFCWDAEGKCLYVGMSGPQQLLRRMGNHMLDKCHRVKWWKDVARVTYIEFADNEAADMEERRQVYLLRPPHNKVFNCGHDLSLPENYIPGERRCRICLREQKRAQADRRKTDRAEQRDAARARLRTRNDTIRIRLKAPTEPDWEEGRRQRAERRAAIAAFVAEQRGTMSDAELARQITEKFGGRTRSHQTRLYEGAYGPKATEHAPEADRITG